MMLCEQSFSCHFGSVSTGGFTCLKSSDVRGSLSTDILKVSSRLSGLLFGQADVFGSFFLVLFLCLFFASIKEILYLSNPFEFFLGTLQVQISVQDFELVLYSCVGY